jgi:hypothetical protein
MIKSIRVARPFHPWAILQAPQGQSRSTIQIQNWEVRKTNGLRWHKEGEPDGHLNERKRSIGQLMAMKACVGSEIMLWLRTRDLIIAVSASPCEGKKSVLGKGIFFRSRPSRMIHLTIGNSFTFLEYHRGHQSVTFLSL